MSPREEALQTTGKRDVARDTVARDCLSPAFSSLAALKFKSGAPTVFSRWMENVTSSTVEKRQVRRHFSLKRRTTMNKEQVEGKVDQAVGKVKQSVGEAVGSQNLANKGVVDQAKGAAKETWGNAKDAANKIADSKKDSVDVQADQKRGQISQSIENAKEKVKDKIEDFKERHSA
jgi:uncharacterized protein YjbJ (UPF0337 family)